MASTPVTAPSPDDSSPDDSSTSPPAPSNSSSSAPPPKSSQPSPPPPSPSPPPPPSPSPPPPSSSPPPSSPPPPPSSPPPQSPPPPSSPPPPPPSSPPPKSPPPPPSSSDESPSADSSTPNSNESVPPPPPPPQTSNSSSSSSSSSASSSATFFPPPPPPPKSSKSVSSNAPPLTPPQSNNRGKPSPSGLQKSPPSSNDDTPASMSMPLVIGVVAGITVFLLIILVSALVCCCSKKKKKKHVMHYYDPAAPKGNEYYNNGGGGAAPQKWQHQGVDHNIKILPPPGLAMLPPGGGGWVPGPPAPLSGDMNLSYSGPQPAALPPPSPNIALGFNKSNFTYNELEAATGGFSQNNLLGQGGFGYVYKGYLPNGKEVAVKQLKSGSGQGEKEFQAEVEIISRVHHRHLVSLVGYCIAGAQRMLVYEFVPNNTLEYHLHGKGLPTMSWPTRLKIAIGSAKGFSYLHEDCHPRIIHRDIKTANILLDYKFEAMVADFGLAKLTSDTNTHVSTRIMGTFGYLAPEYASSGKLTDKSDVFSFGVMLLELITGRRPIDHTCMDDNLVDWARPIMTEALAEGNFEEIADPKLEGNYSTPEMARMVACAAACVRHSARRRPKMSQIVRALEGDGNLDDLHEGMRPGQSMFFSSGSDCNMGSYSNNMRQFRKVALGSGDSSGEYSGQATSEYGLNPSDSSGSSGEMHSGTRAHKPRRQL